ncbi:hypothetical protein P22_2589 [Propionispora sp. 2/2-37]|uniref:hypothetical protein n=1 Tax=Propionispora sp. 2/2-37 TaxID=1677858 RepID=UPI0006BB5653|nr:hypothetical protein [Propionispora sp. 2/2-37]CUH96499.1 hypothetical protein P22_2589 [Propionispora sp. 2/2-37]
MLTERMYSTIQHIRQAEESVQQMYKLSSNKPARKNFTSEEWNLFVDSFQELLQLEYSLRKLKYSIADRYGLHNNRQFAVLDSHLG